MKGDFSRFTHDPKRHYNAVLKQQGRVDLDADWNEFVDILKYLGRTEAVDVIGPAGVPKQDDNFKLDVKDNTLVLMPGRFYANGIVCENHCPPENPLPLTEQPFLPGYGLPTENGYYLFYLDVWERHVTALEDPDLKEKALGGPDTTTRVQTIWQVWHTNLEKKLPPNLSPDVLKSIGCKYLPHSIANGAMAVRLGQPMGTPGPCEPKPSGGYRGLENRLYRVEIHKGGNASDATFKWSRDNGAVVFPIASIDKETVTVKRLGRDQVLTLKPGDWVEISGDETELWDELGTLAQINGAIDEAAGIIPLSADVSKHETENNLKIRRWDHAGCLEAEGALSLQENTWLPLEAGLEIKFQLNRIYSGGDYWLIPTRAVPSAPGASLAGQGIVEWPHNQYLGRQGIIHHYRSLAVVYLKDGKFSILADCRKKFPPLTDIDADDVHYTPACQEGIFAGLTEITVEAALNKICEIQAEHVGFNHPCLNQENVTTVAAALEALCDIEAGQVSYVPGCEYLRKQETQTVADALDALCNRPTQVTGGGCRLTVSSEENPDGRFENLETALKELIKDASDICLCLLPGTHTIRGNDFDGKDGRLCLSGCGAATRLYIQETRLTFSNFAALGIADVNVIITEKYNRIGALNFDNCRDLSLWGMSVNGGKTQSYLIGVKGAEEVRMHSLDLTVDPGEKEDDLGIALAVMDANADWWLADCSIQGSLTLYGDDPFSGEENDKLFDLLNNLQDQYHKNEQPIILRGNKTSLRISGCNLTRINVDRSVWESIREILQKPPGRLPGLFETGWLTDTLLNESLNYLVFVNSHLTSNVFTNPKEVAAAVVIGNSSIYVGNRGIRRGLDDKGNPIEFIEIRNITPIGFSERAANLGIKFSGTL